MMERAMDSAKTAGPVALRKNVLGLPSLLATAVGLVVASSTLVSLGQGMGIGGYYFILAQIIAFILMVFQAFTFSELALMLPKSGSIAAYTEISLGHLPAVAITVCGYVLIHCIASPAELAIAGKVAQECFFPFASPLVLSLIMLCLFVVLNMFGVDIFANFQILFTGVMLFTLAFLGIGGYFFVPAAGTQSVQTPAISFTGIFGLVSLGVWLLIGAEFILPLVEEAKNPRRDIPLAMILGLFAVLVFQGLYGLACAKHVSLKELAASPIPHVIAAKAMFGKAGFYWIGVASFCATASTINTVMAAVPRMLYGMAHAGQVPRIFKYLHPRFRTPWIGIFFMALIMGTQLLIGISTTETIVVYIVASAFSWLLCYAVVHVDLVVLRFKYPTLPRPYKSPLYPVPQVLGLAGIVVSMVYIFPNPIIKMKIYKFACFFLGGAALYALIWVKGVMKMPLFKPVPYEVALKE